MLPGVVDSREIVKRAAAPFTADEIALVRKGCDAHRRRETDWFSRRLVLSPEAGWTGRVPELQACAIDLGLRPLTFVASGAIDLRLEPRSFGNVAITLAHPAGVGPAEVYWYPAGRLAWLVAWYWNACGDAPDGWIRHTPSNRRRPGGDPARERFQR